jgi:PIN domain nuclease of toxin-antitoxin system
VKISVGKLVLSRLIKEVIQQDLPSSGIDILPSTPGHIIVLSTLPLHHRDPFDRLLIAQAVAEEIPIVSADGVFDAYPVQRLW